MGHAEVPDVEAWQRSSTTASQDSQIRTSQDWQLDLPGSYQDDRWAFTLDEQDYPGGLEFKFVLDRTAWMLGGNLQVPSTPSSTHRFDDTQVRFAPNQELGTDNGHLQRLLFPPRLDDREWDVIVVGSGMGGGILADQLSDAGLDVLVLEAGSYLFPTHVGNLPRKHNTAASTSTCGTSMNCSR